ncbi:MAG TPA: aromatic amino acid lyase, partial [Gemmataceae bacterium]|nr:aromatic amino acid lyase [Gemmataceae bacterium]
MAPPHITIRSLHDDLAASAAHFRLDTSAVAASRARVEAATADGHAHYGINTGFGALANKRVPDDQLALLQRNLLLSHAVGVGDPVPPEITRIMLRLKIHALGLGYSGVSLPTFRRLLDFDRLNLVPVVPSRGSVGASGDLAPLAHLSLPLIGFGEFWDAARHVPASAALKAHNLEPVALGAKDGLALINGTQLMAGYGAFILEKCTRLVPLFDLAAAMSLEALQGSIRPFDPRVFAVRPHPGHGVVAANVRKLLEGSEILESHRHCGKVQDPYCLRCVPQVHGASRDAIAYCTGVLETEVNGVTDNPLVFDDGDILSCGNFHGQPLALALDFAAIALAEFASISERRIYLLLEGHDGLPRLLMKETGLNSGFMIPQYTAAAL